MATVSFTLPAGPVVYSEQKSGGFLKIVLAIVILILVCAFIWWFYKSMTNMTPPQPSSPPISCKVSGQQSATTDGSDCCTGAMDFNNVCQPPNSSIAPATAPACVPDRAPSLTKGRDCCSQNGIDKSGNCMPPTPIRGKPDKKKALKK
jgi:hypothetical protein